MRVKVGGESTTHAAQHLQHSVMLTVHLAVLHAQVIVHMHNTMHSALDSGKCTVPGGITTCDNGEGNT